MNMPPIDTHSNRRAAPIAGGNARIIPTPIRLPGVPQRGTSHYAPTLLVFQPFFAYGPKRVLAIAYSLLMKLLLVRSRVDIRRHQFGRSIAEFASVCE
jgi:hypothetical protein